MEKMDVRPVDQALGQLLIEKGFLTPDQLDQCYLEQSEARARGGVTFLGHIALRRGLVNVDQLSELLLLQQKRGLPIKEDPLEVVDATVLSGAFGRFTILQRVGLGGTAAVYLAFDEVLKRLVALKILTATLNPAGTIVDRFLKEAQTLARLSHPNLIRIYDTGSIGGLQYIAMEYVQGRNLEELIDRRELGSERVAPIVRDLCACISYAHERGVIHRDLKPSNIMIEEKSGRVVVMDFGIARSMDEHAKLTVTGSILGTPGYMAPEQVRGDPVDIDARTDVYGAGAILFECLAGRPPFDGQTEREVFETILSDEPPRFPGELRDLPPGLVRICLKAMDKDRRGRYASMTEMREDLERFIRGLPVKARPARAATLMMRKVRRYKAAASLALLLVIGAGAFAVFFFSSQAQRRDQLDQLLREADEAFDKGEWEAALRSYERVLNLNENHDYAQDQKRACSQHILKQEEKERTEAMEEQNRRERIRRANQVFVETQEVVTGARKHLYREGRGIAAIRRDVSGVLAKLDAALRDAPAATGFYLKGRVYHLLGDIVSAQGCYDRALEADPTHNLSRIFLGRLLIERALAEAKTMQDPERQRAVLDEMFAEALRHLEAVETGADFEKKDLLLARGYYRIAQEQYSEALKAGDLGVEQFGDEEFYYLNGVAQTFLARFDKAEEAFSRAIEGRINYFEAYFARAIARMVLRDDAGCEADLKKCLEIHPDFAQAWNNLGIVHLGRRRFDLASECFGRAIHADSNLAYAYVNLGICLRAMNHPCEAVELYDRAVKIDPLNHEAYFSRGLAAQQMGEFASAIDSYDFCIDIYPRHANAWTNRGNVYYRMGRMDEAIRDYTTALRLADHWLLFNNRGHAHLARREWKAAEEDFRQAIERNRRHAPALAARGTALLNLKRYEEAVKDFEEALQVDPQMEAVVRPQLEEARRHVADR